MSCRRSRTYSASSVSPLLPGISASSIPGNARGFRRGDQGIGINVERIGVGAEEVMERRPVAQRIIWKNVDTHNHDIIQDANTFATPIIAAAASADAVTMSTRGTFAYHCGVRPSMADTVTVQ